MKVSRRSPTKTVLRKVARCSTKATIEILSWFEVGWRRRGEAYEMEPMNDRAGRNVFSRHKPDRNELNVYRLQRREGEDIRLRNESRFSLENFRAGSLRETVWGATDHDLFLQGSRVNISALAHKSSALSICRSHGPGRAFTAEELLGYRRASSFPTQRTFVDDVNLAARCV